MSKIRCGNERCDQSDNGLHITAHVKKFLSGETLGTNEEVIGIECSSCECLTVVGRNQQILAVLPPERERQWIRKDGRNNVVYVRCDHCPTVIVVPEAVAPDLLEGQEVQVICPNPKCFYHNIWERGQLKACFPRRSHPHAAEDNLYLDGIYAWFEEMYTQRVLQ